MIETVSDPTFKPADFDWWRKKPGISAIVRVRNEEDYLEEALHSILPFFDELVIVYNQCIDRTPEIIARFATEHPERVKAFHYVPEVFPQGSQQYRALPANHVSNLVHYYNFALSKASYRVRAKWDGDMIAVPELFGGLVRRLREVRPGSPSWWSSPWAMGFWWYKGVNLWDRDGEIFVNGSWPASGSRKDHGLFPAGRWHVFRYHRLCEYFRWRWLTCRFVGYLFFHVKGLKKDRGIGVYQFDRDPDSLYKRVIDRAWTEPELITMEEYQRIEPDARGLPDPASLGIRPVR